MAKNKRSLSFVAISGLNFPSRSRPYLPRLAQEIAEQEKAEFILVAGNMLAGRALEQELKELLKGIRKEKSEQAESQKDKKVDSLDEFVADKAAALDEFLPRLKGQMKYHIVIAEKVYDKALGVQVLEALRKLRKEAGCDDIRLHHNPDTKIPIHLPNFGEMRVLVPRKEPWFYENVTGLMQRLVNSFAMRTNSSKPRLILAGCTGTSNFLPRYKGLAAVSVPVLHKLDEQLSTENMVGCVVVKIKAVDDDFQISHKTYDFRTAIFNEPKFALNGDLTANQKLVLDVLKPSSASRGTILFRVNTLSKETPWSEDQLKKVLQELKDKKLISRDREGHRYSISDSLLRRVQINLASFLQGAKKLVLVVKSCWHVGALKALYHTTLEVEPELAEDADAICLNGDVTQGISHNYEYNGELAPAMNGADKHQIFAALMQGGMIMTVFKKRWEKITDQKLAVTDKLAQCLITYVYNIGNHDEHRFSSSKHAIPLQTFDASLRSYLTSEIMAFLVAKDQQGVGLQIVENLVNQKVIRVGESRVVKLGGIPIGLKHPRQGRTQGMGLRIQQTANFFDKALRDWPNNILSEINIVLVANFHEHAAIHMGLFGRTVLGVQSGAMLKDTEFENGMNKAVDHGLVRVVVELNGNGELLTTEMEFPDYIAPADKNIVFADQLTQGQVMEHFAALAQKYNMRWR